MGAGAPAGRAQEEQVTAFDDLLKRCDEVYGGDQYRDTLGEAAALFPDMVLALKAVAEALDEVQRDMAPTGHAAPVAFIRAAIERRLTARKDEP